MSPEISRVLTGACLTWKFLSCFVAFFTIDRFGRRKLFLFSGFGMASCMMSLAIFLYCTEVAPMRLRVPMASISTANHWLWNFVVVMITPVAVNTIGYRYFIVYAVISASIIPLVYFLYPETMGRSLEELEMMFSEGPSIRAIVKESKRKPAEGGLVAAHLREKIGNDDDDEVEYKV
jgi:MFS family permease